MRIIYISLRVRRWSQGADERTRWGCPSLWNTGCLRFRLLGFNDHLYSQQRPPSQLSFRDTDNLPLICFALHKHLANPQKNHITLFSFLSLQLFFSLPASFFYTPFSSSILPMPRNKDLARSERDGRDNQKRPRDDLEISNPALMVNPPAYAPPSRRQAIER